MTVEEFVKNITHLGHASIKFKINGKNFYIDPFKLSNIEKADYIFSTHPHYDHFSEEDIKKITTENTTIFVVKEIEQKAKTLKHKKIYGVSPSMKIDLDGFIVETVYAYNINKKFHPKENNWVGYIIDIEGIRIYHSGDTDKIPEMNKIKVDIAFLPVGGTYTMDYEEASEAANIIKPKYAIPMHYGSIVGSRNDAQNFIKLLKPEIKGLILL
jgi:L-ascorbate metabolism protein UlaG (beta-lactamase superfamily)